MPSFPINDGQIPACLQYQAWLSSHIEYFFIHTGELEFNGEECQQYAIAFVVHMSVYTFGLMFFKLRLGASLARSVRLSVCLSVCLSVPLSFCRKKVSMLWP